MALQADSSRLTAATGWKPKVSLEEGLARTADWWRARNKESWRQLSYMT